MRTSDLPAIEASAIARSDGAADERAPGATGRDGRGAVALQRERRVDRLDRRGLQRGRVPRSCAGSTITGSIGRVVAEREERGAHAADLHGALARSRRHRRGCRAGRARPRRCGRSRGRGSADRAGGSARAPRTSVARARERPPRSTPGGRHAGRDVPREPQRVHADGHARRRPRSRPGSAGSATATAPAAPVHAHGPTLARGRWALALAGTFAGGHGVFRCLRRVTRPRRR